MSFTPRARQDALLRFIHGYQIANGGVSPSLQECAAAIGLLARSAAMETMLDLEASGAIRRFPGKARMIEVLKPPAIPMIGADPLWSVPQKRRPAWIGYDPGGGDDAA